jgi:predicted AlkP superfamily pyrophosphatase or phosphodiesterase
MRLFFTFIFAFTVLTSSPAQSIENQRPKLVVGIVVDQMRYDYLTRFYNKYGDDGFKRLIRDGFSLENAHFNYIPTYTAPGHASIYTGTTPSSHGIIGNNWYDKFAKKVIYCVDDANYTSVGAAQGGNKSPKRMMTTTITDELKMAQNQKGKVISLSIKDRSAVLPGGHTADGAYWFEGMNEGKFITSSYYREDLPKWVKDFNNSDKAEKYLNTTWNTLYNIKTYTESIDDNNIFEGLFIGKKTPTFPYNLSKLKKENGNYELLKAVPYGNSILTDFAKAGIIGEKLGQDNITDFLAISFSSTDYVGHQFGVDSKEVEDTYLRLDQDLASFFIFLDEKIGKDNYTLFLTADHAVVQVPAYLETLKVPAGYFNYREFVTYLDKITRKHFNLGASKLVENFSNYQLFLNREVLHDQKLNIKDVSEILANELVNHKSIYKTVTAYSLQNTNFDSGVLQRLQMGYNQKFSGDVLLVPNPSTISRERTGTTHGSGYNYDTHVPIIFYGKGINKGILKRKVSITDIAPTLSNLLKVSFPNGATGTIIYEALEE